MSAKAGTIGLSQRPTGFVVWTAIVSAVATAALIMSALALTRVGHTAGSADAASVTQGYTPWDAGKLQAMKGRVLAAGVGDAGYVLWDEGKLEAMEGRVLAASLATQRYTLWDPGKVEAMAGRVLADRTVDQDYVLWDEAKLEAMAGRTQAAS